MHICFVPMSNDLAQMGSYMMYVEEYKDTIKVALLI